MRIQCVPGPLLSFGRRGLGTRLLSYDATFLLGDFYVSITTCLPTHCLSGEALHPSNIHERKLKETHQDMFRECIGNPQRLLRKWLFLTASSWTIFPFFHGSVYFVITQLYDMYNFGFTSVQSFLQNNSQ